MPQQAVAKGIGHRLFLRAQLAAASSVVRKTLSGRFCAMSSRWVAAVLNFAFAGGVDERIQDSGFRIQDSGFRIQDSGGRGEGVT
jgi:hypothetical protein